ncbi:MAG: acyltransferase [Dolichospermum sp. UKL201]|jgi:peptidoglycan/LPS O-acetylase OafA/YrhL|nr:MAG: acyltransferase [Dolichospermum sp. UKL201]
MGLLRIVLAVAVIVSHVGSPLLSFNFFGGGVMAVESFFVISGFYMALVLKTKYQDHIKKFYINRCIRLIPIYWLFTVFSLLICLLYWLLTKKYLGVLYSLSHNEFNAFHLIWASISNLTGLGIDAAILYSRETGAKLDELIIIPAAWSLSVEIVFYALAPFILRLNLLSKISLFLLFLGLRLFVFVSAGYGWTYWNYFFMPTAFPFFIAGILSFHLYEIFKNKSWFLSHAKKIGYVVISLVVFIVLNYNKLTFLGGQDWRYYLVFVLSIPFIFHLTQHNKTDRLIGEYSYPLYLSHSVLLSVYSPLRHFIPENYKVYFVLLFSVLISTLVIEIDKKLQASLKNNFKSQVISN